MENDLAGMQKKPMNFSGTSTTLPSGVKPFFASTVSDREPKEFTDSASISPNRLIIEERSLEDMERFVTEWSVRTEYPICVFSVSTITGIYQKRYSRNGSTGPFPEEAEP